MSAPASRCGRAGRSSRTSAPVRDQQPIAESGETLDGRVEGVVEALERALEQQPGRVTRALGDQLEVAVVEVSASSWASSRRGAG